MKIRKLIFLILLIINCITIFYFSNQVADTSSASSGRVVNFIIKVVPQLKNMEEHQREHIANEILQPIVRKLAHFSIYALLGFLTINFAITYEKEENRHKTYPYIKNLKISFFSSWAFGTLYAVTDEIHQLFIQGRSCELRDVCIDSLGVLVGITFGIIILKIFAKLNNREVDS